MVLWRYYFLANNSWELWLSGLLPSSSLPTLSDKLDKRIFLKCANITFPAAVTLLQLFTGFYCEAATVSCCLSRILATARNKKVLKKIKRLQDKQPAGEMKRCLNRHSIRKNIKHPKIKQIQDWNGSSLHDHQWALLYWWEKINPIASPLV